MRHFVNLPLVPVTVALNQAAVGFETLKFSCRKVSSLPCNTKICVGPTPATPAKHSTDTSDVGGKWSVKCLQ